MKIAIVILAYKNPQQLRWLLDATNHPEHHFFLHIDRQKDIEPFRKALDGFDAKKISWLPRRNSYWGSIACVKVILDAFEMIRKTGGFEYIVHLSGQDFPLLDMQTWRNQLEQYPQTSFFFHFNMKDTQWKDGGADRLSTMQFFLFGKRKKVNGYSRNPILKLLFKIWKNMLADPIDKKHTFFGSEFYFILHRDAVERILKNKRRFSWLSWRMSFVLIPEELYLSTMLMADVQPNSLSLQNKTMRTILWEPHGSSPKTLGLEHLNALEYDENWFARKFDFENDDSFHQALLETIIRKSLRVTSN